MEVFAKRLKELRTQHNLSLEKLAEQISATNAALCNWENNVNDPKICYLKELCTYFNVSADYMIGLSDEE